MHEKLVTLFKNVTIDQNEESIVVDISQIYGFSVYLTADAGDGTISLQASVDGTNFFEIDNGAISGATELDFNKPDMMYQKMKVTFTFSSGSGTLNGFAFLKG